MDYARSTLFNMLPLYNC